MQESPGTIIQNAKFDLMNQIIILLNDFEKEFDVEVTINSFPITRYSGSEKSPIAQLDLEVRL